MDVQFLNVANYFYQILLNKQQYSLNIFCLNKKFINLKHEPSWFKLWGQLFCNKLQMLTINLIKYFSRPLFLCIIDRAINYRTKLCALFL